MTRTKSTLKNLCVAMIGQSVGLIISFIARIFFVRILGGEYLGLNGLFTNILTVLSLAELGIGNAIIYSLYKPLAEKNEERCIMLMQFYKKVYIAIGIFILIIGILITPLLPFFIKELPQIANIDLIYILFVINTATSYFFSYKRNLIIADQNRYIATIYRYGFYIILNIIQIIILIISKKYILFLIIQIIFTLLENYFVSKKADKMYSFVNKKEKIKLDNDTKKEIVKNTKAMMMHKIGGVVVNSTDNIIISKFVGVLAVGLYSNYYLITSALNTVFSQIYNSLSASVGNLCVDGTTQKKYDVFKKIDFITFVIYFISTICLLNLLNPFIILWLGEKYIFNTGVVVAISLCFYLSGMRKSVLTFREAEGLFYKDRYKAIIESIINLVASVILALKFGVLGVFLGTIISTICTCLWIEPYILYKYSFNKKLSLYFKEYIKRFSIVFLTYILVAFIIRHLSLTIMGFVFKTVISTAVPVIIIIIFYRKENEFLYYTDLLKSLLNRIVGKKYEK